MEVMEGAVCIPNISPAERRRRLKSGGAFLLISLVLLVVAVAAGWNPLWRLGLFPFLTAAASGYFQWRDRT